LLIFLQNYIRATEIARAAKQELETKSLELEGNKMYVKQLIAKVDELEHNKRTLTGKRNYRTLIYVFNFDFFSFLTKKTPKNTQLQPKVVTLL
jgi:hypothetical protein